MFSQILSLWNKQEGGNLYENLTAGQMSLNPLTPVLPVTARDQPWPFFHFWRHHFWPNLASSIVNFCRRKRSFQWCLDQSDRPNGAWDMHKKAQKDECKTWSKISCHYTKLLHGNNWLPLLLFLRSFLTAYVKSPLWWGYGYFMELHIVGVLSHICHQTWK